MTSVQPAPLINAVDLIRALPNARTLEIGNILFARFICPVQEQPIGIWAASDVAVKPVARY